MDPADAAHLRDLLSAARLGEYELAAGGEPDIAFRLHCWNTELAAAFYGPLQYLEIAVRNALHRQMAGIFQRDDWWDHPDADLNSVAMAKIRDAKAVVMRTRASVPPDCVVAELVFGFWVSLLTSGGRHNYERRFWRPALCRAFPGFRGRRRDLHSDLDYLRVLRNRIAHHRPIYHRHLRADHDTLLRTLDYVSPALAAWVEAHSPVPEVLSRRPLIR
ncbi:hypothetical protein ACQP1V_36725 [Microtetraspora malaysiensis]|uniref:hypothetical protein n=1 Tax=Microtetraspora malaysiensis TaxID=161358 RepID=UPI003D8E3510